MTLAPCQMQVSRCPSDRCGTDKPRWGSVQGASVFRAQRRLQTLSHVLAVLTVGSVRPFLLRKARAQ